MMHAVRGVLLLTGLLLLAGCGRGAPDGWNRSGKSRTFSSADLYAYINGAAEVYLELGLDRLDMQSYTRGGEEITVEIYRMADAAEEPIGVSDNCLDKQSQ